MQTFQLSDRTVGIVMGLVAIGYLVMAWQIPAFALATVPIQSRTFPLGLGGLLLALSVVLVVRPATAASTAAEPKAHAERSPGRRFADPRLEVLTLVITTAAYIALFEPLGFVLATVVYLLGMNWYFGFRRRLVAIAVALAVTLGIQLLFTQVLGVRLPAGVLPVPWM